MAGRVAFWVFPAVVLLSAALTTSEREHLKSFDHHNIVRRHGHRDAMAKCGEGQVSVPEDCDPASADSPCNFVLGWKVMHGGGAVLFNFLADLASGSDDPTTPGAGNWAAVGLARHPDMKSSDSLECLFWSNRTAEVLDGWNNNEPTNTVDPNQDDISIVYGSTEGTLGNCSFKRSVVASSLGHSYSLNQSLYILLAIGPLKSTPLEVGETPLLHHKWTKVMSEVNLVAHCASQPGHEDIFRAVLIRIHGSIMIFVILVLFPLGAVVARYCKEVLGNRWIEIHKALVIGGALAMIVALFLALGHTSFQFHAGIHQIVGILVIPLAFVQIGMGLLRPHAGKSLKRSIFNWVHRCTGVTVMLSGFLLCYLGALILEVDNDHGKPFIYTGLSAWFVVQVGLLSAMEYIRWKNNDETKYQAVSWKPEDDSSEDDDSGLDIGQDLVFSQQRLQMLKKCRIVLLIVLLLQSLGFSLALTGLVFVGL